MGTFFVQLKRTSIIVFLAFSLTSCLMMAVNGPASFENESVDPNKKKKLHKQTKDKHNAKVYTMRGLLGIFSTGMDSLADKFDHTPGISATSLSYHEHKKLSAYLIKQYQKGKNSRPIVLIGHSFGADTQIKVAKTLEKANVPVDLLITLDTTEKQTIPSNVRNYYNLNSGRSIFSVAVNWGAPLKAESKKTHVFNVNLYKDKGFSMVNHFNIDKLPEVQNYVVELVETTVKQRKLS